MASEPTKDATGFFVIRMGNDGFVIVGQPIDAEGAAKAEAERLANEDEEGYAFGVFGKIGTARLVRKIEWKGRSG